jgi:predicted transcriptional regulator
LSACVSWLSFSACIPGTAPTSAILSSFDKKKRQTETELERLFTVDSLLRTRVDSLISQGLVVKRGRKYFASDKGKKLAQVIRVYNIFFNRVRSG